MTPAIAPPEPPASRNGPRRWFGLSALFAAVALPRRFPVEWLVITTLCALLMFFYRYLDDVANALPARFFRRFVEEFTGVFASAAFFPLVRAVARRFPVRGDTWTMSVPVHLVAIVIYGLTDTTVFWSARELLFRLGGRGDYDWGVVPIRYLMELPFQAIVYTLMASAVWLLDRSQAEREAALRAAQLEAQLKQAQLQGLRLQLQPHFLFNALNTISSTMYDDPRAADTMLSRLAELLRVSLRTTQTQEITLAAELEALDHYVALLRARFGDGLRLRVAIDDGLARALVPSLILQPLVENAVRHGNLARIGMGRIEIRVTRDDGATPVSVLEDAGRHGDGARAADGGGWLCVRVADDGPGITMAENAASKGIGLAATRERLRLLYGDAQRLTLETRPARDGFAVRIELPLRVADDSSAPRGATVAAGREAAGTDAKADARVTAAHGAGLSSDARGREEGP